MDSINYKVSEMFVGTPYVHSILINSPEISGDKRIRYLEDKGHEKKKARISYEPGREIGESLMDMQIHGHCGMSGTMMRRSWHILTTR